MRRVLRSWGSSPATPRPLPPSRSRTEGVSPWRLVQHWGAPGASSLPSTWDSQVGGASWAHIPDGGWLALWPEGLHPPGCLDTFPEPASRSPHLTKCQGPPVTFLPERQTCDLEPRPLCPRQCTRLQPGKPPPPPARLGSLTAQGRGAVLLVPSVWTQVSVSTPRWWLRALPLPHSPGSPVSQGHGGNTAVGPAHCDGKWR